MLPSLPSSASGKGRAKKRVRISEAAPSVAGGEGHGQEAADSSSSSTAAAPSTLDTSHRLLPPGPPLSDQERSDAWWSATDFAAVKESVKRQCRDHRRDRRYSDCLTEAYRSACYLAAAQSPEPEPAVAAEAEEAHSGSAAAATTTTTSITLAATTRPNEALVRWVCDEGPRGLEVYSSRLHALRRQRHLQESKHAVLGEQARQHVSQHRCDEALARQACRASRRARTFAALLGQADAWVARRHLRENEAEENDDGPAPPDDPPEVTEESSSPSSCDA